MDMTQLVRPGHQPWPSLRRVAERSTTLSEGSGEASEPHEDEDICLRCMDLGRAKARSHPPPNLYALELKSTTNTSGKRW